MCRDIWLFQMGEASTRSAERGKGTLVNDFNISFNVSGVQLALRKKGAGFSCCRKFLQSCRGSGYFFSERILAVRFEREVDLPFSFAVV